MHAGFVDVAAAARRGLRWWLLRGRRVHGGQGCVCGCELLIVEGWWCESSGEHFLRRCLNGVRAAGALEVVHWAARQLIGTLLVCLASLSTVSVGQCVRRRGGHGLLSD